MPPFFAVAQCRTEPVTRILDIIASAPLGLLSSLHPKKDQPIGLFAEHLDERAARTLVAHLEAHGVRAKAIPDDELVLPSPFRLTGAVLDETGFKFRDASENDRTLGWNEIRVGFLSAFLEDHRVRKSEPHFVQEGKRRVLVPSEFGLKKEQELLLEILAPERRLEIIPETFSYAYLGPRIKPAAVANFRLLLADLKKFAPRALFNAAFLGFCEEHPRHLQGDERQIVERQLRWYHWLSSQSSCP